jgi:hypothetical protein
MGAGKPTRSRTRVTKNRIGPFHRTGGPKRAFLHVNRSLVCTADEQMLQGLDPGIKQVVTVLRSYGIETFESCEGGKGHAFPEPTVRFHGQISEGHRALAAAIEMGLKVAELRRVWPIIDKEPTGPWWELTFVG